MGICKLTSICLLEKIVNYKKDIQPLKLKKSNLRTFKNRSELSIEIIFWIFR